MPLFEFKSHNIPAFKHLLLLRFRIEGVLGKKGYFTLLKFLG